MTLAPLAAIAYRIYDLVHLRYEFDRNRLLIVTAAVKQIVPIQRIERIWYERPAKADSTASPGARIKAQIKGLVWPGCYVGPGEIEGMGLTLFYGVTPPARTSDRRDALGGLWHLGARCDQNLRRCLAPARRSARK